MNHEMKMLMNKILLQQCARCSDDTRVRIVNCNIPHKEAAQ